MNRLERWIAERDGRPRVAVEIDGRPCETVSILRVDVRDFDTLLAIAEAAVDARWAGLLLWLASHADGEELRLVNALVDALDMLEGIDEHRN